MKCDCIKIIREKAKRNLTESNRFGKPVEDVEIEGVTFSMRDGENQLTMTTCSEMKVTLEGQKARKRMTLFHAFCPFCGTRIREPEQKTSEVPA